MKWRITYFVSSAERTLDSWLVQGERGLGPPAEGDEFSFVHHEDGSDEDAVIRIVQYDDSSVLVHTSEAVELQPGDILGGEAER